MFIEDVLLFALFTLLITFGFFVSLVLITRVLYYMLFKVLVKKDPHELATSKVPLIAIKQPFLYYQKHPHVMHAYVHRLAHSKDPQIHLKAIRIDRIFHLVHEILIYKLYIFTIVIIGIIIVALF